MAVKSSKLLLVLIQATATATATVTAMAEATTMAEATVEEIATVTATATVTALALQEILDGCAIFVLLLILKLILIAECVWPKVNLKLL